MDVEPSEIQVNGFVWDYGPDANVEHVAKHFVRPADVQFVLDHDPIFSVNAPGHVATHVMRGRDSKGRALFVAILETETKGMWMAITAHEHRTTRRYLTERGR